MAHSSGNTESPVDLSPKLLSKWMYNFDAIWQMDLLSPFELASLASDKEFGCTHRKR